MRGGGGGRWEGWITLRCAMVRGVVLCCVAPCLSVCYCVSLSTLFSRARARARASACLVYHCDFLSVSCLKLSTFHNDFIHYCFP